MPKSLFRNSFCEIANLRGNHVTLFGIGRGRQRVSWFTFRKTSKSNRNKPRNYRKRKKSNPRL